MTSASPSWPARHDGARWAARVVFSSHVQGPQTRRTCSCEVGSSRLRRKRLRLLPLPAGPSDLRAANGLVVSSTLTSTLLLLLGAPDPLRTALTEGRLDEAAVLAEARAKAEAGFSRCASVLLEASGRYAAAAALRKGSPMGPTSPTVAAPKPAGPPPPKGARVYVLASSLALRERPAPAAKALAWLPIGTALEVLSVRAGFAEVEAPFPAGPSVIVRDGEVSATRAKSARGYAALAFLGGAPPEKDALAEAGDLASLERLVALDPTDRAAAARLVGAAYDAQQCAVAGAAAQLLGGRLGAVPGWRVEQVDEVDGCRSNELLNAQLLDATTLKDPARVPANSCVVNAPENPAPCGFCPYDYGAEPGEASEKAAQAKHEARVAPYERLRSAFPHGPYLRLRLRRLAGTPAPVMRWALAPVPQRPIECGEPVPEGWSPGEPPRPALKAIALPMTKPGETIEVWEGQAQERYGYGVHVGEVQLEVAPQPEPQCCCD